MPPVGPILQFQRNKSDYRRTDEIVRQVIRQRFLESALAM
jgi:hypothetical protein